MRHDALGQRGEGVGGEGFVRFRDFGRCLRHRSISRGIPRRTGSWSFVSNLINPPAATIGSSFFGQWARRKERRADFRVQCTQTTCVWNHGSEASALERLACMAFVFSPALESLDQDGVRTAMRIPLLRSMYRNKWAWSDSIARPLAAHASILSARIA